MALKGGSSGSGKVRGCGSGHGRARVVGAATKVKGTNKGRTLLGSRLWWLRQGEGRRNEVKVDRPSSSPFIKPVGSRKASEQFRYNSEIGFQPAIKNTKKKTKI